MRIGHHSMTWTGYWRKHEAAFDLDRMLAEVRQAGYESIELGGHAGTHGPAPELQKRLEHAELAIAAWGANVTANPWPPNIEEYRRSMDYAAELGVRTICVCGGFLGRNFRTTFDSDYELFAESLMGAIDYARQYGQAVAFHPHIACIVETSQEVERLLRFLPELDLAVDTGHLAAVRTDPVELMRRWPEKVRHLHLKDWDPERNVFMEIGQGSAGLDFSLVFDTLAQIGYRGDVVVERDDSPIPPAESARISRDGIRAAQREGLRSGNQ